MDSRGRPALHRRAVTKDRPDSDCGALCQSSALKPGPGSGCTENLNQVETCVTWVFELNKKMCGRVIADTQCGLSAARDAFRDEHERGIAVAMIALNARSPDDNKTSEM
jgi:hypothetical protein